MKEGRLLALRAPNGLALIAMTLAVLAMATPATAQGRTLGALVPGDTLRVWAVAPRLNGTRGILDRFVNDTLGLLEMKPAASQPSLIAQVPYAALRRVDVQRGRHRSAARIAGGALLGAAGGLLLGATLGPMIECGNSCDGGGDLEGVAGFVVGGATGIIVGGVAGGFIGARFRVTNWQAVRLGR